MTIPVIIAAWNSSEDVVLCIQSVKAHVPECRLIVVDNGSTDGIQNWLKEKYSEGMIAELVRYPNNRGTSVAWNEGLKRALGYECEFAILLNSDVVLSANTVKNLLAVRVKTGNPVVVGNHWPWHGFACVMFKREIIERFQFDERYFAYQEDTDFCEQMKRAGLRWSLCWYPEMQHDRSRSAKANDFDRAGEIHRSAQKFQKKWNQECTLGGNLANCDIEERPLSILVPMYKPGFDLPQWWESLHKSIVPKSVRIFVTDDGTPEKTSDESYQYARKLAAEGAVTFTDHPTNIGTSKTFNEMFRLSVPDDVIRTDSDTRFYDPNWIRELTRYMDQSFDVGICGALLTRNEDRNKLILASAGQRILFSKEEQEKEPRLMYMEDGKTRWGYEVFWLRGHPVAAAGLVPIEVDAVLGCCVYYRRAVIEQNGGLDEGFFSYLTDNEMCVNARAHGWRVMVNPKVRACHLSRGSKKRPMQDFLTIVANSRAHFIEKWGWDAYDPPAMFDNAKRLHWDRGTIFWRYR